MMQEIKTYKTADLVLSVNKTVDPSKLDLTLWDRFLDVLCGDRTYQKKLFKLQLFTWHQGSTIALKILFMRIILIRITLK